MDTTLNTLQPDRRLLYSKTSKLKANSDISLSPTPFLLKITPKMKIKWTSYPIYFHPPEILITGNYRYYSEYSPLHPNRRYSIIPHPFLLIFLSNLSQTYKNENKTKKWTQAIRYISIPWNLNY